MIVYCLGMQSSGSTWLYNVVREILAASGLRHVAYRAEEYAHFTDPRAFGAGNAVLRGHNVESALLRILDMAEVKTVLSFRDPRDAVASFVQRFGDYGAKFVSTTNDITRNLASLLSASQILPHLSFFYEDGFTADPDSVRRLCDFLGLTLPADTRAAIFRKYRADTVKAFLADIDTLPEERRFVDHAQNTMDRETSFHRTHISDMRVGKWRDVLDAPSQAVVADLFEDYAPLLETRAIGVGRRPGRDNHAEPLLPFSVIFSSSLFAPVDSIERFTRFLGSGEVHNGMGIKVLDLLYLPQGIWHIRITAAHLTRFEIRMCQNGEVVHGTTAEDAEVRFDCENRLHDHPYDVYLRYDDVQADVSSNAAPPRVTLVASFLSAVPT